MKPSEKIAELGRICTYLTNRCNRLERELAEARGAPPARVRGFKAQELELIRYLQSGHPGPRAFAGILEHLTPQDHARERSLNQVYVIVSNVRKKLGRDAIELVPHVGYKAGADLLGDISTLKAKMSHDADKTEA
jgi:DNA-binding response OmpR family regulator